MNTTTLSARNAFRFALIFGLVNLFADMTYEGARSATGPFLATLGASALTVGLVAGFGELIGYALRALFGLIGDRTGAYWTVTIVGYLINLLAVPALALAGHWPLAAALMIVERTGRAIRKPATAAMLSFAGKHIGQGWVFGLNEALDQTGAMLGPLIISINLYLHGTYQHGFALLLVPALLTLLVLLIARVFYPNPHDLEAGRTLQARGYPRSYWIYLAAAACVAAGFADFSLIAFHFQKNHVVPEPVTPILYAAAMGIGAVGALVFGKLYDRLGLPVVLIGFALGIAFAPLVFFGNATAAAIGVILWGLGMGAQESLLKPIVANLISSDRRATAFGVFDAGFGIAWFLGSALMGFLYTRSLVGLVIFSVVLQIAALPIFALAARRR